MRHGRGPAAGGGEPYAPRPVAGAEEENAELRDMTRRFWVSAVLSVPLLLIAMAPYFGVMQPLGLAPKIRG